MKIDVTDAVMSVGEEFSAEYDGAFPGIEFLGVRYEFPDGVHVTADWRYDGEGITVMGRFQAETPVECARCLEEFTYPIGFRFAEYYKKQPGEGEYAYQDNIVDLTHMLEDNVVINLPTKLLCREDCIGLCSQCGQDLNEGTCGCVSENEGFNPFSELNRLTDDSK